MHRERRFQAWVQVSMGCNSKCAYHRPLGSRPGAEPPARRGDRRSRGSPAPASARSRCSARTSTRTAETSCRTSGRTSASCSALDAVDGIEDPIREPHPKDFARGDRRDGGVRCGLRARAPAAPVRLHANPEGDATHVQPRALPPAGRRDACRHTELALDRPDRRLPGETEEDFLETVAAVEEIGFDSAFTFVFPAEWHRGGDRWATRCRRTVKRDRIERLIEVVQRGARAQPGQNRPGRGGARRRPEPDGSGAAGGHAETRP